MASYSLIEYKLRRYFYLGHEDSMYVPPSIRSSFWEQKNHDDVIGVRMIGRIVKKNIAEEINSIVPIILKVKKEGKLLDEKHLIFALAVCAKFNLKQCVKMVIDAYAAVSLICTDGLKLLMFVKFCHDVKIILHNDGYLPKSSGSDNGFRKALKKWYFSKDPFKTTDLIVRNPSYCGWSHKDVMDLIHIKSNEPSQKMFIIYTMQGMEKVKEVFGSKMNEINIRNKSETFKNIQLKFMYTFLKKINDLKTMDETALRNEIELNGLGGIQFDFIPQNKLTNTKILTSLVKYLPLRTLLDKTFLLARYKLFANEKSNDQGLWEYILRFNNIAQLEKHQIHPIDAFIEFVKYSRTINNIIKVQNNILKKQKNLKTELPENKLKLFIKTTLPKSFNNDDLSTQIINSTFEEEKCTIQSTVENISTLFQASSSNSKINYTQQNQNNLHLNSSAIAAKNKASVPKSRKNESKSNQILKKKPKLSESVVLFQECKKEQNELANTNNQLSTLSMNTQQSYPESILETVEDQVQTEINDVNKSELNDIVLLKPPPKLVDKILTFLSEDLFEKTLQILKPTGKRIIIAYDNRMCMKRYMCRCTRLLTVHEAITLITISLIVPEKLQNKPTICGFSEKSPKTIEIEYNDPLTFSKLESILFEESPSNCTSNPNKKHISVVNPLSIMKLAKESNKEYDVFVFLGTNKMNFGSVREYIKEYRTFLKKSVKIIVCCLNGKHVQQRNLSRGNMLFIPGFDKNSGKIINLFINGEF